MKIKQREKLKGEVYLTRKFPDLRYALITAVCGTNFSELRKFEPTNNRHVMSHTMCIFRNEH